MGHEQTSGCLYMQPAAPSFTDYLNHSLESQSVPRFGSNRNQGGVLVGTCAPEEFQESMGCGNREGKHREAGAKYPLHDSEAKHPARIYKC
jgi:hypothetical protein